MKNKRLGQAVRFGSGAPRAALLGATLGMLVGCGTVSQTATERAPVGGSSIPEAAGAAPAAIRPGQPQTGLQVVPLTIQTAAGQTHVYQVEVARTPEQQAHGMMFRTHMPPKTGMLFPMQPARPASFWMENTLIPLDLVFVGQDGRIRNIVANAEPLSHRPLESFGPVAAVLELQGGEAARLGLQPGDRISW